MRPDLRTLGGALGVGLLITAAWYAVVALAIWPPYLFPPPHAVLAGLWDAWSQGDLPLALATTVRRMLLGFGAAVALGLPLGMLATSRRLLAAGLRPFLTGLQSLPSVCWFPVAILWLGLHESAIYFITVAGTAFAVASAVDSGIRGIPPGYARAAGTLGISGLRLYTWVLLPAAIPALAVALRQGWSMAWRSLMAAELLYVSQGLGFVLHMARELHDAPLIIGSVLLVLLLGIATDRLAFAPLEHAVARRWGLAAGGSH